MNDALLRSYARLLLKTGVNLQPGQKLDVSWDIAQRDFVHVLVEEAYALGAAYVNPRFRTPSFERRRLDHSAPDHLDFVPGWLTSYWDELVRDDWAAISLMGDEDPAVFEGADSSRKGRMNAAINGRRGAYMQAVTKSMFCWNVAAVPTDAWARQVLGPQASADDLWAVLVPILGLDEPDPAASWRRRIEVMARRVSVLDGLKLDHLHFTAPGTDLTVGLMTASRWRGGVETSANGRVFAPNLPTEEVFTTPDWRRTEGKALVTRPVEVMGTEVEGARFTFLGGRVVEFDATKNRDVLAAFLSSDAQSNALGEVALVDGSSRIFQSGKIFHNILLDENAACHIALGAGYPDAVDGGRDLEGGELLALGCNDSQVHVDFMIGGPEINVTGVTSDGRRIPLIEKGRFRID